MKKNITGFFTISLLATSVGFISCVDNERDLLDADAMKQIYEDAFPVKNVDPNGNWIMSRSVTAHVSVNEDWGVEYKIQVFDANPLNSASGAKLLAEGTANQEKTLDVVMDCATALNRVFVARIDEKGHYLVQPVTIENGEVTAHFGDPVTSVRSVMSRAAATSSVPVMEAPYTAEFISAKKAEATEVQAGWDLAAGSGWSGNYNQYPVFTQSERWFKIPEGTFNAGFTTTGISGGAQAVKVIVPAGSTWRIENNNKFSYIAEIIVEDGGKVEITKNSSLVLTNNSYITVLPGGKITGEGGIDITNGSGGMSNYNAGTIDCATLKIEGGGTGVEFFNYGMLQLESYKASTPGTTFINRGTIEAGVIDGNNNTNIKNGCYINVTGLFQFGTLLMGNTSEATCGELGYNGNNNDITMEAQSMLTCTGKASLYRNVTGPTTGTALLRINSIANTSGLAYSNSKITNNVICEVTDQTSNGKNQWEWSPFDWLVNKGLQKPATYCNPGKADFILPTDGECIKAGYNSDDDSDDVDIQNAVYSYAFEDNYPNAGDYDFNDIVLNVTLPAAGNNVKELKYTIDLRAVGATKQLGAGLRIRGIDRSNVEEVSFGEGATQRAGSLNSGIFENVAYETSGNELVIPLFGDAHYIYGYTTQRPMLNTGNASSILPDIYTLEVTVKLKNAVAIPSVSKDLDFFIAYKGVGKKRTEIHLNQFDTATANGQLADSRILEIIKVINNTWALCVPDKFAYPTETTVITDAYDGFAKWAQNQDTNTDWYTTPISDSKVIKY